VAGQRRSFIVIGSCGQLVDDGWEVAGADAAFRLHGKPRPWPSRRAVDEKFGQMLAR
jgi:hypothetical protein